MMLDYDIALAKYQSDAAFKQIVDAMVHHMTQLNYSPGEMRQAAVFAEILFQQRRPAPFIQPPSDGIETAPTGRRRG